MKKLIIALELDSSSQKIAEEGYAIARQMKAQPVLLHVASEVSGYTSMNYSPIMGFGIFSNEDIIEKDSSVELKKMAEKYLSQVKKHLADDSIETIIEYGEPAEGILEVSSRLKAGLIVLGSHSKGGLKRMILGSVAEKVLRHSSIPLLVIPLRNE